ncbi:sensor histidine kinase [Streptomyces sp. EKR5.2]|uniref:sensor histidine kinase n=1 Tax=Streptomyces sp. EKR5.2 TaxID=3461014 RepID=UPI0040424B97
MAGTPADDQPNPARKAGSATPWQQHLRSGRFQSNRQNATGYSKLRPTVRVRLTLLYGGIFLVAGAAIISIIHNQVAQGLENSARAAEVSGANNLILYSDACPTLGRARYVSELNDIVHTCLEKQHAAALDSLQRRSLICLLALTVLAFAIGYFLAGRVLHPLGRITGMMRSIASFELAKRIELSDPEDELKELADTFDDMMDRLDRAFNAQQRFVSNASHELRTPLAISRTLLEVHMSDPNASPELAFLGNSLLATNHRSEQLVEGLLMLARSENELVERKPVDMAAIAAQAVQQVSAEAEALGLKLHGVHLPAQVDGNSVMLERLAFNLVRNAVQHNLPTQGWVEVKTSPLADHVTLTVINSGPLIPAYEVDNLFEPFTRLRDSHTGGSRGVGLGLAIVRSVACSHGGTVTARPRTSGGLEVEVRLPARHFPTRLSKEEAQAAT